MKLLLTGFDPFGGEEVNPAWEAVKLVPEIKGIEIEKLMIPTVFKKGPETIFEKIKEFQPDVVLSIGQAGGRSAITPEFVGINYADARIKDNEGNQPVDEKLAPQGPDAYFTNLNVREMVERIKKENIPAFISYTAGTFVCNDVLYSVRHFIEEEGLDIKSGFIHVPFAPDQVIDKASGTPSMELGTIARAIEIACKFIRDME